MKRNKVSLSNTKLLSCDLGELVPMGLIEVLPGDTFQQATSCLVRFAPMLAPVMHKVNIQMSHWFIPHRLVWEDWEDFITGGPDGNDDSVFPTVTLTWAAGTPPNPPTGTNVVGQLPDYLGVPPGVNNLEVSALPFRAYAMVWNEWFRDQDLQAELAISLESGPDSTTSVALQNAAWEKDYFTTARPWEQKGPQITIPLGDQAVVRTQATDLITGVNEPLRMIRGGGTAPNPNVALTFGGGSGSAREVDMSGTAAASSGDGVYPSNLYADLSGASAVTVNLLREALALQRYQEARARFGSRYVEYLRYLGVRSSDARLQRPEFLGGGIYPVQFSEVLQTAEGTDPVGELRGHGIGAARSNRYRRFFEEHGYVLSLMTVKPKTIYSSGLHRTWNRRVKEDFWQVELQHIGQQEVYNKEVYAAHSQPNDVFGYQDRYDEYRNAWSSVSGEFRDTLDFWHFARSFSSDVALNADFVKCVPTENPFAVGSTDVLYVMARHSIQARRMVARTGNSFIY